MLALLLCVVVAVLNNSLVALPWSSVKVGCIKLLRTGCVAWRTRLPFSIYLSCTEAAAFHVPSLCRGYRFAFTFSVLRDFQKENDLCYGVVFGDDISTKKC